MAQTSSGPSNTHHSEFVVHIDSSVFEVASSSLTGAELRHLPTPPIGPELDLWEDVPGGSDILIGDEQTVAIKDGMHFFTAPANINPGEH